MEKQERKKDSTKDPAVQSEQAVKANPEAIETGNKLQGDIDQLIDEIDEVLEENSSEFVKNYVQKGGE